MSHNHKLIYIREFTGDHRVYWCRDCGLIMEIFNSGKFANMIPKWSKDRLLEQDRSKEKYIFIKEKLPQTEKRLGRGLKDIMSSRPSYLENLLKIK